jgi:hypothetical protein
MPSNDDSIAVDLTIVLAPFQGVEPGTSPQSYTSFYLGVVERISPASVKILHVLRTIVIRRVSSAILIAVVIIDIIITVFEPDLRESRDIKCRPPF